MGLDTEQDMDKHFLLLKLLMHLMSVHLIDLLLTVPRHNLHDLRDGHHDGVPRDALRGDGPHDVLRGGDRRHDVLRDGHRRDDVHHDLRDDPIVLVHTSDFDFANFSQLPFP